MKKTYIAALALVAFCLSSCGSRKEEPVEAEMVPIEDAVVDDSLSAEAAAAAEIDSAFSALNTDDPKELEAGVKDITNQIETLYSEGDEETAAKYLSRLQEWYKTNKAKVQETMKDSKVINNLLTKAKEAKTKYAEKATELKDKAMEKADEFKEEHVDEIEAAKEKAGEVKTQVKEKTSEVTEKAKAKVQEVKDKHGDEVKAAAGAAKSKAKEAASKLLNK